MSGRNLRMRQERDSTTVKFVMDCGIVEINGASFGIAVSRDEREKESARREKAFATSGCV
ncbi:unnamed protein product [Arabis nemorensis]|uniref:Uncharacterized protein n=1 Tax=Arabis nemorensis TaxID=586526 RepID=A0A565ALZ5_9BRAS|nr:unnamed protein product [Arabis nemorensis]